MKRSSSRSNSKKKVGRGGDANSNLFRRYQIFGLANPRSGDGLASGFLTDYPHLNEKRIYLEALKETVDVEMRFYNVLEGTERTSCLRRLEQ